MAKKDISYWLNRIEDPQARKNVEGFYNLCKGKVTLKELNEPNWTNAIRDLYRYETFYRSKGQEPKFSSQLVDTYKAYLETDGGTRDPLVPNELRERVFTRFQTPDELDVDPEWISH